jgi:thiol-disulfide isomerase/thioredoxin
MSIILLEESPDTMTFTWAIKDPQITNKVEFVVNDQPSRIVDVTGGILRKKNLAPGDQIGIRLVQIPPVGYTSFIHSSDSIPALPPNVTLEVGDDGKGLALIEFPPKDGAEKYQVDMCAFTDLPEWIIISDVLQTPGVRKKNLSILVTYSFRFRCFVDKKWGSWSSASLPQNFPPVRQQNLILSKAITSKVIDTNGTVFDTVSKLSGKVIGLYFSASWCGPCRQMTPKLMKLTHELRNSGKNFEIVFVSCDHDEASYNTYFKTHMQGWLAIPWASDDRERLQQEHRIQGIPSLKIVSYKTGKVVEGDALRSALHPSIFPQWEAMM